MSPCRVAAQSWQRKRQFLCLVAEERSSKKVVASCILSLAAPDAVGTVCNLLAPPPPILRPQSALSHICFTQSMITLTIISSLRYCMFPHFCKQAMQGLSLTGVGCYFLVETVPPDAMFMRLLQLLPAPFPTTKPWRLYCSNMAVATAHRRKGLATSLLHHCQRAGMHILSSLMISFMQSSASRGTDL